MKAITFNGIITSLTAKVDGSLGLRIATPELTAPEKTELFGYQNINSVISLEPLEEKVTGDLMVMKQKDDLSRSELQRKALYALWMTAKEHGEYVSADFKEFYNLEMDKFRENIKERISQYE
jgi:hypothetical protein